MGNSPIARPLKLELLSANLPEAHLSIHSFQLLVLFTRLICFPDRWMASIVLLVRINTALSILGSRLCCTASQRTFKHLTRTDLPIPSNILSHQLWSFLQEFSSSSSGFWPCRSWLILLNPWVVLIFIRCRNNLLWMKQMKFDIHPIWASVFDCQDHLTDHKVGSVYTIYWTYHGDGGMYCCIHSQYFVSIR